MIDSGDRYPRTHDDEIAEMRADYVWSLTETDRRQHAPWPLSFIEGLRRVGHYSIVHANGSEVFIYPTMKHEDKLGFMKHAANPYTIES